MVLHLADKHGVPVEASGREQHDAEHAALEIEGDLVHESPLRGDCRLESAIGPDAQHTLVKQVGHAHLPAHARTCGKSCVYILTKRVHCQNE